MNMNKHDDGGQSDNGEQSTIPSNNNTNLWFYRYRTGICTKQLYIVIGSTFSIVETFAHRATRRTLEQTSINS
jgi:hypothetical protein